mmetsp:Transcript_5112/g.21000  ORF Transcript_5112/g.21000 Transcript_5112/m.21000 type:complete len:300 (+) Transcript_5112:896-1795(+)
MRARVSVIRELALEVVEHESQSLARRFRSVERARDVGFQKLQRRGDVVGLFEPAPHGSRARGAASHDVLADFEAEGFRSSAPPSFSVVHHELALLPQREQPLARRFLLLRSTSVVVVVVGGRAARAADPLARRRLSADQGGRHAAVAAPRRRPHRQIDVLARGGVRRGLHRALRLHRLALPLAPRQNPRRRPALGDRARRPAAPRGRRSEGDFVLGGGGAPAPAAEQHAQQAALRTEARAPRPLGPGLSALRVAPRRPREGPTPGRARRRAGLAEVAAVVLAVVDHHQRQGSFEETRRV